MNPKTVVKAIVLLSGGLDSAVTLKTALEAGREVTALSFGYGQAHEVPELQAAGRVARHYGVSHIVTHAPLCFGASKLAQFPGDELWEGASPYYVPARNSVLLALAANMAESTDSQEIWVGFNQDDAAGFPDCRPGFIVAYNEVLRCGTVSKPRICAPLLYMTKAMVAARAWSLNVPVDITVSCYAGTACGACSACQLRGAALGG